MTRPWKESLVGQRFGRLLVIEPAPARGASRYWAAICDCGASKVVSHGSLRAGTTMSCGCLKSEVAAQRMTKHGAAKRGQRTRAYKVWAGMKARCEIVSATGYENYGGRGVRVCERWQSFAAFLEDMGQAPDGLEIDRKRTDGDYEPGNCRWVTRATNAGNKRNAHRIEFGGEVRSVAEWARHLGINKSSLYGRLAKWPLERALSEFNE